MAVESQIFPTAAPAINSCIEPSDSDLFSSSPASNYINGHTNCINGIKNDSRVVNNDDDDEKPLFPLSYISPEVAAALPPNYTIRPLRRSDYHNGFLEVLRVLTRVGEYSYEQWSERYDWMAKRNDEYFLIVICDDTGRVVGTGSLLVERKFIRSLGMVGHIEDIAIESGQQGKKLGLRMIHALDYAAKTVGCYKVWPFSRHLHYFFSC